RLPCVHHQKPQHQRNRRHDLEIDECLDGDAPDTLCLAHACDAVDDGAEDDRRDDHPYEPDEQIAQRTEGLRALRPHVADDAAEQHRKQNLQRKVFVERTPGHSPAAPRMRVASAKSWSTVGCCEIRCCSNEYSIMCSSDSRVAATPN